MDLYARGARASPEQQKAFIDGQMEPLGENALRLLDDDPRLERLQELVALGRQRFDLLLKLQSLVVELHRFHCRPVHAVAVSFGAGTVRWLNRVVGVPCQHHPGCARRPE